MDDPELDHAVQRHGVCPRDVTLVAAERAWCREPGDMGEEPILGRACGCNCNAERTDDRLQLQRAADPRQLRWRDEVSTVKNGRPASERLGRSGLAYCHPEQGGDERCPPHWTAASKASSRTKERQQLITDFPDSKQISRIAP